MDSSNCGDCGDSNYTQPERNSKLEWSDDEFSVGVQILDEQHKRLVHLINELHGFGARPDAAADEVGFVLEELQDYVRTHFTVEEEFMRLFHYPGYDRHRRAHSEFGDLVKQMAEGASRPRELADFLTTWLTTHVLMSDQDLGKFLTDLGVR